MGWEVYGVGGLWGGRFMGWEIYGVGGLWGRTSMGRDVHWVVCRAIG